MSKTSSAPRCGVLLAAMLCCVMPAPTPAQDRPDPPGFDTAITELQGELADSRSIESTLRRRRALKNIARDAERLAKASAQSPRQFAALSVMFHAQRELLLIKSDRRTREDLLNTARKLLDAPDAYAQARLQADFLLDQVTLDADGATDHQRAVAIAELADRYRDTSAEVESLKLCCEVAFNLGRPELLSAFRYTLVHKFGGNLKAVSFLQERFSFFNRSMPFHGRFDRADGQTLAFPIDRMGHVYLACFWSKRSVRLDERLAEIKALQTQYPGRFEVYSFNLDDLADAGQSILTRAGLDWTAMRFPGGTSNTRFGAFGGTGDFHTRIINLNGYMTLRRINPAERGGGRLKNLPDYLQINIELPQYLAMFQSLRTGEFLIQHPTQPFDPNSPPELIKGAPRPAAGAAPAVPGPTLQAIQACFVAPPMRYRLKSDEVAKRLSKCIELCDAAIRQYPGAPNLWVVYNRRIIAQVGLWQGLAEPKHLVRAAADAKTLLKLNPPPGADLPARFCLALQAIRQEPKKAKAIIDAFVDRGSKGQDEPPAMLIGAAMVLSMNASESEGMINYRRLLLDEHLDEPQLWSLTSCLYDASTYRRLFRANIWGIDVMKRHGMRWYGGPDRYARPFGMKLETLDGKPMAFPDPNTDRLNIAVVMAPPADEQAAKDQRSLMDRFKEHTAGHLHGHVNLVVVFVRGKVGQIRAAAKAAGWTGPIARVPEGLANPHVLRLGIFAAGRRPNTFIVKPDGTIWWSMTGMNHHTTSTNAVAGLARNYIKGHDYEVAERAMEAKDYNKALNIFSGSFPGPPRRFDDNTRQQMGKARAYLALDNYEAARKEYDQIIARHEQYATRRLCGCSSLADLLAARAQVYTALNDEKAAEADLERVKQLTCPAAGRRTRSGIDRYHHAIHRKLLTFTAREDFKGAAKYLTQIIAQGQDGRQPKRQEFADHLTRRSIALDKLGEPEAAARDRQRALALTQGITLPKEDDQAKRHDRNNPRRYVDLLKDSH
jgi:hypothetical protein